MNEFEYPTNFRNNIVNAIIIMIYILGLNTYISIILKQRITNPIRLL